MDIVYPVRIGNRNEELKHSLRSLTNLIHDRVHIFGYCPSWLTNVKKHPMHQTQNPYVNTTSIMLSACMNDDISDPFIWMNDDYFVIKPIDTVPTLNRGLMRDLIGRETPTSKSQYRQGMIHTQALLSTMGYDYSTCLSYELHVPLVVAKDGMLTALEAYRGSTLPNLHKRTLYGNLSNLGGSTVADTKYTEQNYGFDYDCTFISTSDISFERFPVGAWIREQFSDKSVYEI